MKPVQRSLFPTVKSEFGGSLRLGKRKERRPLVTKRPMHVVFRSSMANGEWSFHRNRTLVTRILTEETKKRRIRTYRLSINSNHFHFLLQGATRKGIQDFLRVFSGRVAQGITKAYKGRSLVKRFWDHLVFTRVVEWGREFRTVAAYVLKNELEALGLIPYERLIRGAVVVAPPS